MFVLRLAFLLLVPVAAQAKDHSNEIALFKATMFARQYVQAGTYENLSHLLLLTDSDRAFFVTDLKKAKLLSSSLPPLLLRGTLVTIGEGKEQLKIDFKEIANKVIFLNDRKIEIKKYRAYMSSQVLMRDLFKAPPKSAFLGLFINRAYAQATLKQRFEKLYAALISSQSSLEELTVPMAALEETILQTYEKHVEWKLKTDSYSIDSWAHKYVSFMEFTCKDNRLDTVSQRDFDLGKMDPSPSLINSLKRNADSGGYLISEYRNSVLEHQKSAGGRRLGTEVNTTYCEIEADSKGSILVSKLIGPVRGPKLKHAAPSCPSVGESIYDIGINTQNVKVSFQDGSEKVELKDMERVVLTYGEFPKVADACCQKKGCAEKVKDGVSKIFGKYTKTVEEQLIEDGKATQ